MILTRKDIIGPLRPVQLGDQIVSFDVKSNCLRFTIGNKLS